MKQLNFPTIFTILCALQIFVSVTFNFPQILVVSILPMLILQLPPKLGTPASLLVAFATGFAVDFLTDGMLGLTSACLLPVALLRLPLPLSTLVFFTLYVWVDGAGMYPFLFNVEKILLSTAVSFPVSALIASLLFKDKK